MVGNTEPAREAFHAKDHPDRPEPLFTLPHRTSGSAGVPLHNRLPFYRAYATGLPSHVKSLVLTSDLQGREAGSQNRLLGVPVAEALSALSREGVIPAPDAVFLCGDLFDYPDCRKRGGTGPVDEVFQAFSEVTPEVVGVLGNHDQMDHPEALPDNTTLLDGGVVRVLGNLNVGGVSGIVGNPNRNQRRTEDDFLAALESVTDQAPDILLLHQGPTDPEGRLVGVIPVSHCHLKPAFKGSPCSAILDGTGPGSFLWVRVRL